jgi:hypothetical protein
MFLAETTSSFQTICYVKANSNQILFEFQRNFHDAKPFMTSMKTENFPFLYSHKLLSRFVDDNYLVNFFQVSWIIKGLKKARD